MGKRPKKSPPKTMKQNNISLPSPKTVMKKAKDKLFGKKGKVKRRQKSALWYAKAIQRIKLKRRYEKVKLGGLR